MSVRCAQNDRVALDRVVGVRELQRVAKEEDRLVAHEIPVLYVCTLPSIPVVRNVVMMGMVPGAGVAYLIAGTGTNYGEVRAIGRPMSRCTPTPQRPDTCCPC